MSDQVLPYAGDLRRLGIDEYHRLTEAGILDSDERVELLDGFLVAEATPSPPHVFVVRRLMEVLMAGLPNSLAVRVQFPLTLATSELQPDLAVVERSEESAHAHPRSALLVVEVASGSLSRDRGPKAAIYARAGIPEYWIVNLSGRCVEVLRDPDPAGYRVREVVAPPGQLRARSIPLAPLDIYEILPS